MEQKEESINTSKRCQTFPPKFDNQLKFNHLPCSTYFDFFFYFQMISVWEIWGLRSRAGGRDSQGKALPDSGQFLFSLNSSQM